MNLSGSIEDRIRAVHDRLSLSHRRLAEYLLESQSEAAFFTARQLADALGISESTVVRLAPELGYDGFPALQVELRRRLLSRVNWQSPMRQDIDSLPSNPAAILQRVVENDVQSLQNLLSTVPPETFAQAAESVAEAGSVYVLGLRTSSAHALYAAMRLRLVRPRTRLISAHHGDLPDQLLEMGPSDLLIAISYLRYATDTVRALKHVRKCGARSILITDDPLSPPAKVADIVLVAYVLPSRLLHTLVAPLTLLNALVAVSAVRDREQASQNIGRANQVIADFDVLLAPDAPSELRADESKTG